MRERPILFSGPMVRALLAGTKTQTRRVVKPQPGDGVEPYATTLGTWNWVLPSTGVGTREPFPCPYGDVGDRLWVRETFTVPPGSDEPRECVYRADIPPGLLTEERAVKRIAGHTAGRWTPGIHMFRWASRITLAITGVRAQRLQEITDADAYAEGVTELDGSLDEAALCRRAKAMGECAEDPRVWFAELWDSINAARGFAWASNPWVWAVSFRVAQ